jgi:hypothetical protein
MSACPILAQQQYIKTQDRVCAQHFKLSKETGVKLPINNGINKYQN